MRKILTVILLVMLCSSCGSKSDINYTYDIQSKDVDMSEYDGVNSTNHNFRAITVNELFNCIDNKSSGIFYLGRTNCACCQTCAKYIDEASRDLNVIVYYMDVYNEDLPITTSELMDKLRQYLFPILEFNDEGQPELQTPTVFTVINGEFDKHLICMNGTDEGRLLTKYKEMFKPFLNKNQD